MYARRRIRSNELLCPPSRSSTEEPSDRDAPTSNTSLSQCPSAVGHSPLPYSFDSLSLSAHDNSGCASLNANDMALLSHYITHTSRIISLDDNDYHVLHVCVPSLAFRAESVMASLLALSAICMARESIEDAVDIREKIDRIQALFELGAYHHRKAFELVQNPVYGLAHPEMVYASAILIPLYAAARQSSSILLARMATSAGLRLPVELDPEMNHCISLTRATHVLGMQLGRSPYPPSSEHPLKTLVASSSRIDTIALPRIVTEDGPSSTTGRLFAPVIWSTCNAAIEKLRLKVETLIVGSDNRCSGIGLDQACLDAVILLENISQKGRVLYHDTTSSTSPDFPDPACETSELLHGYLRRQNDFDAISSLRRTVMSFMHRTHPTYMDHICWLLGELPPQSDLERRPLPVRKEKALLDSLDLSKTIAAEVFAHWLVFVMLLDGVWFIGGMGMWELERLTAFMHRAGWRDEESWWPADMCRIMKSIFVVS